MGQPLILVVDDDQDMGQLSRHVVVAAGFDADLAVDGRHALEILRDGLRPDLILLDIQMPVVDGWQTLEAIRSDRDLADVAVILCTVKSHKVDRLRGWRAGCDGYVTKPYSVRLLQEAAQAVLARTPEERLIHRHNELRQISDPPSAA